MIRHSASLLIASAFFLLPLSLALAAGNGTSADPSKMPSRADILNDFKTGFSAPVEKYFDARDQRADLQECRKSLDEVKKEYKAARKEKDYFQMETLLVGDEDSELERDKGLAKLLDACGRCSTKVTAIDKDTRNPIYESDGWCRLPGTTPAGRKQAFEVAVKRLANPKTYAKSNGGLNYVMLFDAIDGEGKPTAKTDSPFLGQFVVKGLMNFAFGYNIVNHYTTRKDGEIEEFLLQFARVAAPKFPPGLKVYDFPETEESGGKPYIILGLPEVHGQWFVDTEGNFRYFNRAKFSLPPVVGNLINLEKLAHRIHMDTLFHIYDDLTEGAGE